MIRSLPTNNGGLLASSELSIDSSDSVHSFVKEEEIRDLEEQILELSDELKILLNSNRLSSENATIVDERLNMHCKHDTREDSNNCNETNFGFNQLAIEDQIRRRKQQLEVMKNILHSLRTNKKHSKEKLPNVDYNEDYLFESSVNINSNDNSDDIPHFLPPHLDRNMTDLFNELNHTLQNNDFGKMNDHFDLFLDIFYRL